ATYSMIGIGFGGVLNCFLDPLFIYVFDLGVAGASMATAISKTISFLILVWPYVRKRSSVQIAITKVRYVLKDIREVLAIGSTSFFRSALSVVANVTLNRVAGGYSTSALAAISIANRIMDIPFAVILGFGQGYQPIAGFNWGAKQWKRVRESLRFVVKISLIGSLIFGAILAVFSGPIISVFNTETDAEVLRLGQLSVVLQSVFLFSHTLNSNINMFYAGIGKAKYALLMSTARQGYVFIPVVLIAPLFLKETGVACAQAIADIVCMAIAIPLTIKAFRIIAKEEANTVESNQV
ncbi:MAG: MATE family efflux transporter, partial [Candidatus Ventricola sp.]